MKLALVTLPAGGAFAFALVVAVGCSAPDPGAGVGSYRSHGGATASAGNGSGGASSTPSGTSAGTPSTPSPSGTGVPDSPGSDAGGGGGGAGVDAGSANDSGGPSTAKLGSCLNPICGTDGVQCGCHATDSAGGTVEIGCQGGQCVCVVNGTVEGNPTDDPNACDSQTNVKDAFLANCACN